MKVLFLLSSVEPDGAELNAQGLAQALRGKHEISWISSRLHFGQSYLALPLHRGRWAGFMNPSRVAAFIRKNGIQLLHSHSTRACAVASAAAKRTGIRHVATFYRPPENATGRRESCEADAAIAVDEAIAERLSESGWTASRVRLIRNGVDLARFIPSAKQPTAARRILVIGRLTGERWKGLQFLLTTLERIGRTLPRAEFKIVGQVPEGRRAALVSQLLKVSAAALSIKVELFGFVKEILSDLRDADGVIAGGRSAMEAMACGKSVLFLGERGVLGVAKPSLWPLALRSNFGDHLDEENFSGPALEAALRELLNQETGGQASLWSRSQIETQFNLAQVAAETDRLYRGLVH